MPKLHPTRVSVFPTFSFLSPKATICSANGHFHHFRCFVQSLHRSVLLPPRQPKPCPHLVLDILLADKDEKHEEAAEQVEAVDHPEEDLEVVGVAAEPVRVVGVEDVVDGGEHPEDSQDQEQLCVEHLKRLFLLLNKERKLECVCC